MDDDIVRFLVSTDNHLGYAERDPVRCNDSFAAFEEVLKTAEKRRCDFVLLAGDLFHENKPSRRTLHTAMELFRRYCFGGEPVFIEVLNEQGEIFRSSMGKVNYEDPFQSISLPIFSIHGNHDDPSREGGAGEALAALDLFAVSNLLNYIGKVDRVDNVEIVPILISKGSTKLALYGLGAMRDERLNRMWNQKKVKFVRLTAEQGRDEFFNIFVLHQNRDYGRGKKSCLHESMIPEWMDLVIWGNEHECLPNLSESLVGTYRILQPGSSVACSLSAGESSARPKHMVMFEVKDRKFRSKPIPYQNLRQFIYDDLSLKAIAGLSPNDPKVDERIKEELRRKVQAMIAEARAGIAEPADTKYQIADPNKVLIRLRVDHEGFPSINHQRFGAQFVGEVANPSDVLLLVKRRKEGGRAAGEGGQHAVQHELKQLIDEGAEEEIHRIKIEDLVNEALANSKNSLALLVEAEMAQALDDYIVKKLPNAIQDLVTDSLERTQRFLQSDLNVKDKAAIAQAADRAKQQAAVRNRGNRPTALRGAVAVEAREHHANAMDEVVDDELVPARRGAAAVAATARKAAAPRGKKAAYVGSDDVPTARRGRAAKTTKKYVETDSENDAGSLAEPVFDSDESDQIMDVSEEEEREARPRGRKGAAAPKPKAVPKAKAVTSAARSSAKRAPPTMSAEAIDLLSDDDDSMANARTKPKHAASASAPVPAPAAGNVTKKRQLPLVFSQGGSNKSSAKQSMSDDWDV